MDVEERSAATFWLEEPDDLLLLHFEGEVKGTLSLEVFDGRRSPVDEKFEGDLRRTLLHCVVQTGVTSAVLEVDL